METDALQTLSGMQDLVDVHEFMDDEGLLEVMELVIKCIAKPDIPPAVARTALLKIQAYAFKFRLQALDYNYINKDSTKKNVYYAISQQCTDLAQTLKYLARERSFD